MGDTKSFSVDANRSHLGVQMCRVIQVWDNSHSSQIHAYWYERPVKLISPILFVNVIFCCLIFIDISKQITSITNTVSSVIH